mgnify:CR=1 FL=1
MHGHRREERAIGLYQQALGRDLRGARLMPCDPGRKFGQPVGREERFVVVGRQFRGVDAPAIAIQLLVNLGGELSRRMRR